MSSAQEEPAHEVRLGLSSLVSPELLQRATLEVRQGSRIVRILTPNVTLELTGDAYEQFMEKLTQWRLLPGKVLGHEIVISIPHLRRVSSAQSLSLTRGSEESSIIISIEMKPG